MKFYYYYKTVYLQNIIITTLSKNAVQFAGIVNDNISLHTGYLTAQQMLALVHIQK